MYLQKVKELVAHLKHFSIEHIPRSENQQADALARLASSAKWMSPRTITWEVLREPSINEKREVAMLDRGPSWRDPIINYLKDETLLDDVKEAKKVKKNAKWFILHDNNLYKSFTHTLLKCITPEEGDYVLRQNSSWGM